MASTMIIGRSDSTKHDAIYVGHHKKLKTNFCLVSLSTARTRIYRLVLELPSWNGALICYGHAVLQLLGGSSTIRTGVFHAEPKRLEPSSWH